jgi:hypothetical protein
MALPARFRVAPIWQGRTVVILGSGPSLSVGQLRLIARAKHEVGSRVSVIAVNDAVYGAWWADWLHSCDQIWWFENIQMVHTFPGTKTTLAEDVPAAWVDGYLKNTGLSGFDEDPSCCRTGASSGYQAMHIAIHAGARKIILVGFDMKAGPDGSHFFGEHRHDPRHGAFKEMLAEFEGLEPVLKDRQVEVVNATPDSALTVFPMEELRTALYT